MDLWRRIERHLANGTTTATRFGRDSINDPRLVSDLRRGRELRPRTAARIARFLDQREGAGR